MTTDTGPRPRATPVDAPLVVSTVPDVEAAVGAPVADSSPQRALRQDPAVWTGIASVLLGLLAVLLLALVVGGGAPAAPLPTGRTAGPLTGWALPVLTLAGRIAAVGTVGSLVFAVVLARSRSRALHAPALRVVSAARWWAIGWAAAAAAMVVLTASDLLAISMQDLRPGLVWVVVTAVDQGRAMAAVVVLTVALAASLWRCRTARAADLLLVLSLLAVLPPTMTGHSATSANHEVAVGTLMLHVLSATVWVGGLLALVAFGRSAGHTLPATAARFSTLALGCFAAAGVTGVLSAYLNLGGGLQAVQALGTSGYGRLVLAKLAALVVLGAFGWWHRRSSLARLAQGRPRAFVRLAGVEVVVLLATVAMAVALGRAPAPAPVDVPTATSAGQPSAGQPSVGQPPAGQPSAGAGEAGSGSPSPAPTQDMSGHDHGPLVVGILIDEGTFHVSRAVAPGGNVSILNAESEDHTVTAQDGSFDLEAAANTLFSFTAPEEPGGYPFVSTKDGSYQGVLVVREN
ncbi:MAG: CopD family protein [Nocardioides sp.]|nr:CopD family protein [Nocardioides sp.]